MYISKKHVLVSWKSEAKKNIHSSDHTKKQNRVQVLHVLYMRNTTQQDSRTSAAAAAAEEEKDRRRSIHMFVPHNCSQLCMVIHTYMHAWHLMLLVRAC